jgi:hypothetical protein
MSVRDADTIQKLVEAFSSDAFLLERIRNNVDGPAPTFERERLWYVLVGCLLTTQQKSTQGSPVSRFLATSQFPLCLPECHLNGIEQHALRILTDFGGIRRTLTIARQTKDNLAWLEHGGWSKIEQVFNSLRAQRSRTPRAIDKVAEREAAGYVDEHLHGFGPKQSRNLWQWLGLTRYEIPLDSRVVKWTNENLSFRTEIGKLDNASYYESSLDRLQAACAAAEVLPCIFDAAAFNDENKPLSRNRSMLKGSRESRGTTLPGYVNVNGQITVRDTGMPGTDHLQRIYQLACSHCGHPYGANGSDIHERRCPECQGGAAGLSLLRKATAS